MRRLVLLGALVVLAASVVGADQRLSRFRFGGVAVEIPNELAITTVSLDSCQTGEAYSTLIQASYGTPPYTWSLLSGSLPAGLMRTTNNINGTPETDTETFTIRVTDDVGAMDDQQYTLVCSADEIPALRTGHPKLFVTPASDTGVGLPLDTLRTRITTTYSADFQTFITAMNAAATSPTGKGDMAGNRCQDACVDGIGFAFLAMLDPAVLSGYSWSGKTQANYITYAKEHALYIALHMGRANADPWHDNTDGDNLQDDGAVGMAMALLYDWTRAAGATWSDADKRLLLDGIIDNYRTRRPAAAMHFHAGNMNMMAAPMLSGLAFDASEVPSGSPTVSAHTYVEYVADMKARANDYWFSTSEEDVIDAILPDTIWTPNEFGRPGNIAEFMTLGHSTATMAGNTEGTSYQEVVGNNHILTLLTSSAYNYDMALHEPYWANYLKITIAMLRPIAFGTGTNGDRLEFRFGVAGPGTSIEAGKARYPFWWGAALAASSDATLPRVARWYVDTGFDNIEQFTDTSTLKAFWPFTQFMYGLNHYGAAMTPSAYGFPKSFAAGNGWYFFRTGHESVNDTHVTAHMPRTVYKGGHWRNDFSAFTIEKFGPLVINGGQNKGAFDGHVDFQAEDEFDHAKMHVLMPGETGGYKGSQSSDSFAVSGGMAFPEPAGSTGYCETYRCNLGDVTRYALNGASDGLDYLRYVYQTGGVGMWDPLKVSYSDREFVYRRGATDHEYAVVVDRVTTVVGTYDKRWNVKLPFTPSCSTSLTNIILAPDFINEQGGEWTCPSTSTWMMSNTAVISTYQQHGRLFLKSLTPAGLWHRVSGDFYEGRDNVTRAPYGQAWNTITSSSTTGGVASIIITGAARPDTGHAVLISGSSDANLNGMKTVTSLGQNPGAPTGDYLYTTPCASCTTGGAAILTKRLKTDTGRDSYGNARLELRPTTEQTADVFVTVLQWGDSNSIGTTMTATTALCSGTLNGNGCTGSMVGAEIADSTQKTLYLFSTSATGAVPTMPATVTPTLTGSLRVFVFNLTPSTTYYYKADPAGAIEVRTSTFGGATSLAAHATGGYLDFTYTR